jgi:hypothetical protein
VFGAAAGWSLRLTRLRLSVELFVDTVKTLPDNARYTNVCSIIEQPLAASSTWWRNNGQDAEGGRENP